MLDFCIYRVPHCVTCGNTVDDDEICNECFPACLFHLYSLLKAAYWVGVCGNIQFIFRLKAEYNIMSHHPISRLQEHFAQRHEKLPEYCIENVGTISDINFKCTVTFGDNLTAVGYARNKQEAKKISAEEALALCGYNIGNSEPANNNTIILPSSKPAGVFVNYVGSLNELASTRKQVSPSYKDMPASNGFCVECSFLTFTTQGDGCTKKNAKQDSAKKMLNLIKDNKESFKFNINIIENNIPVADTLDKVNETALNKFSELQHQITNLHINEISHDIPDAVTATKRITTEDELLDEISRTGVVCKLETIQRNPCILSLSTDSGRSVFGVGHSRQLAVLHLIETIMDMMENGFRLS